jgi:5'-3' exonuclease
MSKKKPLTNPILFQYVKIHVLREYLALELEVKDGIHNDVDNKIDDFIFLCFFVGNDFLPHLPSFRIRNGAIDLILSIYKGFLPQMNGYLTKDCKLNMENINFLLKKISLVEEELGQDTTSSNQRFQNRGRGGRGGHQNNRNDQDQPEENKLEKEILAIKRTQDFAKGNFRLKYYQSKFHIEESDLPRFLEKISKAYLEGINWVYSYYYTGCPSWEWYYPYHYAPLAFDLVNHPRTEYSFSKGVPYRPMEQLMAVLPKQSGHALPICLRKMLAESQSEIIDFYPIKFPLDTNGFKFAWMGVNLLPFVNEKRLIKAVRDKESEFSAEDKARNVIGCEQLLFSTESIPNLSLVVEKSSEKDFNHNLTNDEGHRLSAELSYFDDVYQQDANIPCPRKGIKINDICVNKVLNLK